MNISREEFKELLKRLNHDRVVEEADGFEGVGAMGTRLCLLRQLQQCRNPVLESWNGDDVLGDPLVCRSLVGVDGLDELEIRRIDVRPCKRDDVLGNGCRKKQGLAWLLFAVGQQAHNVPQFLLEADVEHAVSLVKTQGGQVGGVNAAVFIAQEIIKSARCADQKVAALHLGPAQHHALVHATDGRLDDDTSVSAKLAGFGTDLLSQLSGGRDDDGSDVVGVGSRPRARGEAGVVLDDPLDGWQEEANGLASAGPGLRDDVFALEGGVDAHGLNIRHALVTHVIDNGAEDVVVDADRREIREAGDAAVGARLVLALGHGRRARVASRDDLTAE